MSEINTKYLDERLARIDQRILHEKLMELVPTVKEQFNQNRDLVKILHRMACVLQKHQVVIPVDKATGLTHDGYNPDQAMQEVSSVIAALRELAVRLQ